VAAGSVAAVAGELDEIELVRDRDGAREIGEEEERALERSDEQGVETVVVGRDLGAELGDASLNLLGREVRLADPEVVVQRARSSLNRWARRSMSRR
jgi:hypothetical protein